MAKKAAAPKTPELKISYKQCMSFEMQNLLQKLINTPTSNKNASHINKIFKKITKLGDQIRAEFKEEILAPFALKGEDGKVKELEGGGYEPDPARIDDYNKAMEKFEGKEGAIEWGPLRPAHLADIKVSAKEIDILGELYTEQEGPGLPHGLHSV